jgi:MoxR-like ATPase
MGYPDRDDERQVLVSHREAEPVESLDSVIHSDQILELQRAVRQVTVEESIYEYLLDIVTATRHCSELHVGVSTRGAICLYRAAQALATIHGRQFVVPDDIKQLAVSVLSHRVVPKGYLHGGQRAAVEKLIQQLVDDVPVPG